jgi:hypothetical protein
LFRASNTSVALTWPSRVETDDAATDGPKAAVPVCSHSRVYCPHETTREHGEMINRPLTRMIRCFLGIAMVLGLSQSAFALRKNQPWNKTTGAQPDARAGGWFINLGITGARAKILLEAPKILEVTYVFDQTPASGVLQIGDKIVGANGKPFTEAHKFGYGPEFFGYEGPISTPSPRRPCWAAATRAICRRPGVPRRPAPG